MAIAAPLSLGLKRSTIDPAPTVRGAEPPIPAKKRHMMNWVVVFETAAPILNMKKRVKNTRYTGTRP